MVASRVGTQLSLLRRKCPKLTMGTDSSHPSSTRGQLASADSTLKNYHWIYLFIINYMKLRD